MQLIPPMHNNNNTDHSHVGLGRSEASVAARQVEVRRRSNERAFFILCRTFGSNARRPSKQVAALIRSMPVEEQPKQVTRLWRNNCDVAAIVVIRRSKRCRINSIDHRDASRHARSARSALFGLSKHRHQGPIVLQLVCLVLTLSFVVCSCLGFVRARSSRCRSKPVNAR
jgi:hypothetical protein